MLGFKQLFTFFQARCSIPIRVNRRQLMKGRQNKTSEEKNEGNSNALTIFLSFE